MFIKRIAAGVALAGAVALAGLGLAAPANADNHGAASPASPPGDGVFYVFNASGVNIHTRPDVNSTVVGQGQRYDSTWSYYWDSFLANHIKNGFLQVTDARTGVGGWVKSGYLEQHDAYCHATEPSPCHN